MLTLLGSVLLSGCAMRQNHITHRVVSPEFVDQEYLNRNFVLVAKDAEIVLNRHFFIHIPLNGYYTFNESTAVEELLHRYGGDLVTDVTIESKFLFLLYYNRYYLIASGNVWKRKKV